MTCRTLRLLVTLTLGLLLIPRVAGVQEKPRLPMVGVLTSAAGPSRLGDSLLQHLRDLGYVEGDHFVLEERYAGGTAERLVALAADLVQQEVAVIVASGYAAVRAAQDATHTIPVVMLLGGDPIGSGLIPSLTRPGGNLTGLAALSSKFSAKRLALLKAVAPTASQVAVLFNPDDVSKGLDWTQTQVAARAGAATTSAGGARSPHLGPGVCRHAPGAGRRAHHVRRCLYPAAPHPDCDVGDPAPAAGDLRTQSLCGGGRAHGLWPAPRGDVPARRRLRRQDPQRRETR